MFYKKIVVPRNMKIKYCHWMIKGKVLYIMLSLKGLIFWFRMVNSFKIVALIISHLCNT